MALYELTQEDVNDLWRLVSGSNLTLTANNAARVAQLQAMLSSLQPTPHGWHGCEECKERADRMVSAMAEMREEITRANDTTEQAMRVRDSALLEAGLDRKRVAELESQIDRLAIDLHLQDVAHTAA